MSEDNAITIGSGATLLCGKSWTAYVGTMLLALILFGALLPLAFYWNKLAAACVMVASTLIVGYRVLLIRSHQLYYDEVGVWLSVGILPWSKGISGVKWRDMDEATFVPDFFSWLFKSYTIRVGHRFTKSSEIVLTSMARGKDAVIALNTRQQEMIRSHGIV
ncbi:MAG TPA: hypothetical protein DCW29_06285 [Janthinobacterium sp.]|nr:hypothetical protein [Janthinobacterium sp.]